MAGAAILIVIVEQTKNSCGSSDRDRICRSAELLVNIGGIGQGGKGQAGAQSSSGNDSGKGKK